MYIGNMRIKFTKDADSDNIKKMGKLVAKREKLSLCRDYISEVIINVLFSALILGLMLNIFNGLKKLLLVEFCITIHYVSVHCIVVIIIKKLKELNTKRMEQVSKKYGVLKVIGKAYNKIGRKNYYIHVVKTEKSPTGYYGFINDADSIVNEQYPSDEIIQVEISNVDECRLLAIGNDKIAVGMEGNDMDDILVECDNGTLRKLKNVNSN